MDASLYKYFIEELQGKPDKGYGDLPLLFVNSAPQVSDEAFAASTPFLKSIVLNRSSPSSLTLPYLLTVNDNFFALLFMRAHKAFVDILSGEQAQTHEFRHDGTQLLKFLVYCGNKGVPPSFYANGPLECAMICCTIEALLHCGWCPDSFDGIAKRVAHEYLVCLKKEMHHITFNGAATVLGYLWSAWLLSQKTEGIRDNGETTLPETELFEWGFGIARRQYLVRKSLKAPLFYILPKYLKVLPHPFHDLSHDALLGLHIFIKGEPVLPQGNIEYSDILRPKISGHKFVYACVISPSVEIVWTVVFLHFENTFYRIDILKFPGTMEKAALQAAMHIENAFALEKTGSHRYRGGNCKNVIIQFVENPLELEYSDQLGNGTSVFSSKEKLVLPNDSIKVVTAWAQGKGLTDINRTHLLGIYD